MSLAGNLEDLGLGDIVQIVSLSRKSGILFLRDKEEEGLILFRHGHVVRARSSRHQRFLGQILLEMGAIDEALLTEALRIQKQEEFRERLGRILIDRFQIEADRVEAVAREQIRQVMKLLFTWTQGTFDFELKDDVDAVGDVEIDPIQFMLEHGLDPQMLLGDEYYLPSEKTGRAADTAASANAVSAPGISKHAVVVDDDNALLELLAPCLSEHGWQPFLFSGSEEALITIDRLYREGVRTTVLTDLIMPRMDGSGILGGLELLELLHRNYPDLAVLAMADYHNLEAERKVRSMGFPFLLKPRRTEIADPEKGRFFCCRLLQELERNEPPEEVTAAHEKVDFGAELLREMGVEHPAPTKHAAPGSGISLLRSMLGELSNPAPSGGIVLLVLRFAAEFMNRAVIFSIKEKEIIALGQFGLADEDMKGDTLIRDICIPRGEPSVFSDVLDSNIPMKLKPVDSDWNRYLFDRLGGIPAEVFLGPIVSAGKTVAVLYGDNLPGRRPLGDTDSLEIFLSQAGMAMEKALLERRLREIGVEAV